MGRTEKITPMDVTKNPRLLKACNITSLECDMGEFFFISNVDEIEPKLVLNCKEKHFFISSVYFNVKFI